MIDIQNCSVKKPNLEHQELPFEVFGHPQQVLEALQQWLRRGRWPDDDDDPPPCPADVVPRPRAGGGPAFAPAEPAWA